MKINYGYRSKGWLACERERRRRRAFFWPLFILWLASCCTLAAGLYYPGSAPSSRSVVAGASIVFVGGQIAMGIFTIVLFVPSWKRWVQEIERILNIKIHSGILFTYGMLHFAAVKDSLSELEHLSGVISARGSKTKKSAGSALARPVVDKNELVQILPSFTTGSREQRMILKALQSRSIQQDTVSQLLDQLQKALSQKVSITLQPTLPVEHDRIAELERTYLAEIKNNEEDGEAKKKFRAAWGTDDRKQRRSLLTEAISLQRNANRHSEELAKRARALRKA